MYEIRTFSEEAMGITIAINIIKKGYYIYLLILEDL